MLITTACIPRSDSGPIVCYVGNARLTAGRSQSALEAVRQVLPAICSLEGRVEDPESRTAIHNRAIDLESTLDAFSMLTG